MPYIIALVVLSCLVLVCAIEYWVLTSKFWDRYHAPLFWSFCMFLFSLGLLGGAILLGYVFYGLLGVLSYVLFVGPWLLGVVAAVRYAFIPAFQYAAESHLRRVS